MIIQRMGLIAIFAIASPVAASEYLAINGDAVAVALIEASRKLGMPISLEVEPCLPQHLLCRWKAGGGIEVTVSRRDQITGGAGMTLGEGAAAYQIEAGWNNSRKETAADSDKRFRGICASIVAILRPQWNKSQLLKIADQMAILRTSKKLTVDFEQKHQDVVFYGTRSRPERPDFPSEAFVQCGAVANTEAP